MEDGSHLCMVVIGTASAQFVQDSFRLADEYEVAFVRCDDVYSAVAEVAGRPKRSCLIVGTAAELAREQGRFFSIAAAHAAHCASVTDHLDTMQQRTLVEAARAGASIVTGIDDLRAVVEDWLVRSTCDSSQRQEDDLLSPAFQATDEELRALLEPGPNE